MKTLITGGAGFIGSHLAEILVEQGHTVRLVDDLSTGRKENVAHLLGDHCSLQVCRVGDLPDDGKWLEGFDQVYHLAAAVGVQLIVDRPVESIETNVMDTAHLLRATSRRGVPTLVASSSEVYGKSASIPFKEEDDVAYGATIYRRWSYAMTKAIDEYLALAHHDHDGLPAVVVRLFNTVGPRQVGQYGMVIPRFIQNALSNQPIQVFGDGQQSRCFCHVRDVAGAMPKLLAKPECRGRVFNLGSCEEVTILDLARRVIDLTGSKSQIQFVPYDQAYSDRFDDLRRRVPDLSRIEEAIGFSPTHDLDQILHQLIELARTETTAQHG
jgi:UDP-glucose 4-epimerase